MDEQVIDDDTLPAKRDEDVHDAEQVRTSPGRPRVDAVLSAMAWEARRGYQRRP